MSVSPLAVAQVGSVQGKSPWMGKEEGEVKPSGGWARSPFCCQNYMLCAILSCSRSKNAGQVPGLLVQLKMISFVDIFACLIYLHSSGLAKECLQHFPMESTGLCSCPSCTTSFPKIKARILPTAGLTLYSCLATASSLFSKVWPIFCYLYIFTCYFLWNPHRFSSAPDPLIPH